MRIALGSNSLYYPAHGGGERSNRMLMEALAQKGHACLVISRIDRFEEQNRQRLLGQLVERQIAVTEEKDTARFQLNGVDVVVATSPQSFRAFFTAQLSAFKPEVIITSTDDPAQLLLEAALQHDGARTVYLTRATVALPFGPDAAFASPQKTDALRRADGIVGVSQYVADYIRKHSGIPAIHVPIALPEPGPHPELGRFENEFVTMGNPCAVKGISIFLALAKAIPQLSFAAIPTWGTTSEDLAALEARPNVTILPAVEDFNKILARTRVLLVPSVWAEARSRIVVEAMLAGVPVMSSNLGGLPEAKMGIAYNLPVRPIESYTQRLNEQMVPIAEVPEQDIGPWQKALARLTEDRAHWEELASLSRRTALDFAANTTIEPFEQHIQQLKRKPRTAPGAPAARVSEQFSKLSPERRKLLEMRLRKQTAETAAIHPVLPYGGTVSAPGTKLFCFPHAGGTASQYRGWKEALSDVTVAPVQYPGRENRKSEPLVLTMEELVHSLFQNLRPHLTSPFVFFGHSMGAIVAFELTRLLRREGLPQPVCLIASAARAPQYRLHHQAGPDPSRKELIEQVKKLGGVPEGIQDDPTFQAVLLPILEADTSLYRRYVYHPEAPLDVPIVAMGGEDDPNVTETHLADWQKQTASRFTMHRFPGGHFYLREHEAEFFQHLSPFL